MPTVSPRDLLQRVLEGVGTPADYISAITDRVTGRFEDTESEFMDYKEKVDVHSERSVAELARDILGFSNTRGGVLVIGVNDSGLVVGHPPLDAHSFRESAGQYLGTFVEYELGSSTVHIGGRETSLAFVLVPRCGRSHPNLLRKDILAGDGPPKLAKKIKYLRGSFFFREGDSTRVEPTGGDIESRSHQLGFSAPAPRVGSAFLLEEDKPGIRIYSHITEKFVGRKQEVNDLLSRLDDPRGRGISLSGLGGIGKTELAIEVVLLAYTSKRFKSIYSGSAKKNVYSSLGAQETDPCFHDFPSFLRDLGAWLGLDFRSQTPFDEMKVECLRALKAIKKPLLFVDNLETIQDHRLFDFLDSELPPNVWLLTTSRVERVKNYLYTKQVDYLLPGDAARLLRTELKRQGLKAYADMPIEVLEGRAINLQRHPLLIRWYAWNCSKRGDTWQTVPKLPSRSDVESFCIGQTLASLSFTSQQTLAAIAALQEYGEVTPECLRYVIESAIADIELALYEIESAGLVLVAVDSATGQISYTTNSMADGPARELARKNDWETKFARGFRNYQSASGGAAPPDPLVRSLIDFDASRIKSLTTGEIQELESRIDRVLGRPHPYHPQLLALKAECERHCDHTISADNLYKQAADGILNAGKTIDYRSARILLEAATVARAAVQTDTQYKRAIAYLEAIQDIEIVPLRVFGMLIEMSARIGDSASYKRYLEKGMAIRNSERRFSEEQLEAFDEALSRATSFLKK